MTICETGPRVRRGVWAPPLVDGPLNVGEILADIERREFVSLPELGARIGMNDQARKHAIREGLVDATPGRSKREGYSVSRDEAITLVLAAVLALAAGVAIVVTLRGCKGAGLTGAAAAATLGAMPK